MRGGGVLIGGLGTVGRVLGLLVGGRVWIGERGWRRRGVCCRFHGVERGVRVWRRRWRRLALMSVVKSMRMRRALPRYDNVQVEESLKLYYYLSAHHSFDL